MIPISELADKYFKITMLKMKIKTTMRCHLTWVKMAIIKENINNKYSRTTYILGKYMGGKKNFTKRQQLRRAWERGLPWWLRW